MAATGKVHNIAHLVLVRVLLVPGRVFVQNLNGHGHCAVCGIVLHSQHSAKAVHGPGRSPDFVALADERKICAFQGGFPCRFSLFVKGLLCGGLGLRGRIVRTAGIDPLPDAVLRFPVQGGFHRPLLGLLFKAYHLNAGHKVGRADLVSARRQVVVLVKVVNCFVGVDGQNVHLATAHSYNVVVRAVLFGIVQKLRYNVPQIFRFEKRFCVGLVRALVFSGRDSPIGKDGVQGGFRAGSSLDIAVVLALLEVVKVVVAHHGKVLHGGPVLRVPLDHFPAGNFLFIASGRCRYHNGGVRLYGRRKRAPVIVHVGNSERKTGA